MRGHFSIEWMSQSSQLAGAQTGGPGPGPGAAACGTHSESLPGFYCKIKSESSSKRRAARSPAPRPPSSHGTDSLWNALPNAHPLIVTIHGELLHFECRYFEVHLLWWVHVWYFAVLYMLYFILTIFVSQLLKHKTFKVVKWDQVMFNK